MTNEKSYDIMILQGKESQRKQTKKTSKKVEKSSWQNNSLVIELNHQERTKQNTHSKKGSMYYD